MRIAVTGATNCSASFWDFDGHDVLLAPVILVENPDEDRAGFSHRCEQGHRRLEFQVAPHFMRRIFPVRGSVRLRCAAVAPSVPSLRNRRRILGCP